MNNTVEENTIDVWDHVLDKESANNLSEMMKVIWWQHGHLSRGDIFNPFFHLDCGQTVQDVERSPYKDYVLPDQYIDFKQYLKFCLKSNIDGCVPTFQSLYHDRGYSLIDKKKNLWRNHT